MIRFHHGGSAPARLFPRIESGAGSLVIWLHGMSEANHDAMILGLCQVRLGNLRRQLRLPAGSAGGPQTRVRVVGVSESEKARSRSHQRRAAAESLAHAHLSPTRREQERLRAKYTPVSDIRTRCRGYFQMLSPQDRHAKSKCSPCPESGETLRHKTPSSRYERGLSRLLPSPSLATRIPTLRAGGLKRQATPRHRHC